MKKNKNQCCRCKANLNIIASIVCIACNNPCCFACYIPPSESLEGRTYRRIAAALTEEQAWASYRVCFACIVGDL